MQLKKKTITLDDGRYLIFFSFDKKEAEKESKSECCVCCASAKAEDGGKCGGKE